MALVIRVGPARANWWLEQMQALLPDIECRLWDSPGEKSEVHYALVWRPPAGGLREFANLRCIVSMGAGIDHVLADPYLPTGVPIIRTTGADLSQRMREYVVLQVLRIHRCLPELEAAQARGEWLQLVTPPAPDRRVGVMGLGNLGADCAAALAALGFNVVGWSRRAKSLSGIQCYFGDEQLNDFLSGTQILICLLPLTPATDRILNRRLFAALAPKASVINVARGGHLQESDLLDALDAGELSSAVLDVFDTEPLPADHPFWGDPRILITPHVGSLIDPVAGGKAIAANLRRFINGEPIEDLVDLSQGY